MQDVALHKSVSCYRFWFHREPDYRPLAKG
jgi:hypothetical protein